MDLLQNRLREVDDHMPSATVSLAALTTVERELANELCNQFRLPLGSLLRRADAVRLAGGQDSFADCLREAACHLIYRSDDHDES